ncbi:MAG TPA: magnesium transporter, partial [Gammaproteobacteria bacterium]|nr:magnesium transporter [Gammaproteobacteria bacterium]
MSSYQSLEELIEGAGEQPAAETKVLLASLRPREVAIALEASPPKIRRVIWELLDEEVRQKTLQHLNDDVRSEFLDAMNAAQLAAAAEEMDTDDLADILQQLPATLTIQVLEQLSSRDRSRVEAVLSYPEDSAGGLMNTDMLTVRPRHPLELVLRYLRLHKDIPATTDALIVVNSLDEYVGLLPFSKLLTTDPTVTVREVMDGDAPAVHVLQTDTDVARIFSERDLISAPVVDDQGRLVGRITIDDV